MTNHGVHEALVVAGGRGTRLQPLTFGVPKPLLPFCGQPFLAGVLARLERAGITRTWLVVGADTEPFQSLSDVETGMEVQIVPERTPLDTAGGVRSVVDRLDGAVLVLNGDVITDVDLSLLIAHHRRHDAAATIALTRVDDTSSYGVCVREGSRIVDFVEKPPPGTLPGQDAINAGTYVLDPASLATFPQGPLSFERDVFPGILAAGGRIESMVWDGVWMDLGTPDRWLAGVNLALAGTLAWPALDRLSDQGERVLLGDATIVEGATLLGPVGVESSTVAAGATVGPNAWLGPGVVVDAAAKVRNSVVMDGSTVGDGIELERVIVGRDSLVEAGAAIGTDVVIGHGQLVRAGEAVPSGARRPPRRD